MNRTTGNVHRIDTPGPGLLYPESVMIEDVRWVSPLGVAGHRVEITDAQGFVLWESVVDQPNYVERDVVEQLALGGYVVPTLQSGAIYIRIERNWEVYG